MSRHPRRQTARQTVAIIERGEYTAPSGRTVAVADRIAAAVRGTVLHRPAELDQMLAGLPPAPGAATRIEVTFLTSPAPNRGAIRDERTAARIPEVLRLRARKILAVAAHHGHRRLVLGAWGCGVFRNDPDEVARAFADPLAPGGEFAGRFDHVVFAVWDTAKGAPRQAAFERVLAPLTA